MGEGRWRPAILRYTRSNHRYETPKTGLDLADNHGGAFMKPIRYLGVALSVRAGMPEYTHGDEDRGRQRYHHRR